VDDIPIDAKRHILTNEITAWKNGRYLSQARLRAYKAAGDTEQQAALIKDLAKQEVVIHALEEELATLPAEEATGT
jgi:hypothetical protein